MAMPELTPDQQLTIKMRVWERLNTEVLQQMIMLDFWLALIVVVLIWLTLKSREADYADVIVWAAILGAVGPVWIGRADVLIHRPVPATKAIEDSFGHDADHTPVFKGWENWYKARLTRGVKILVPLDLLAGVFMFVLFMHANNSAYRYLGAGANATYFWWICYAIHLFGWGIIASAKWLAE